jgi:hypothetical protein
VKLVDWMCWRGCPPPDSAWQLSLPHTPLGGCRSEPPPGLGWAELVWAGLGWAVGRGNSGKLRSTPQKAAKLRAASAKTSETLSSSRSMAGNKPQAASRSREPSREPQAASYPSTSRAPRAEPRAKPRAASRELAKHEPRAGSGAASEAASRSAASRVPS